MSDLLKEALLDVQQVKEVAEKNARNMVLERLMPKLKDYIENKLMEDTDVEDHEELPAGKEVLHDEDENIDDIDNMQAAGNEDANASVDLDDIDDVSDVESTDTDMTDTDDEQVDDKEFDLDLFDEDEFESNTNNDLTNENKFGGNASMYELS